MCFSMPLLGASGTRGVCPAQMRSSEWSDNGLVGVLMDWLWRWGISDFWRILLKWLKLFWCADGLDRILSIPLGWLACAFPCCSFAEISPEVILRDEVRNEYICSVWNNRSIIKPRGWDFLTTPTRFEVWKVYFSFARISSALTPLASSFLTTASASAFFASSAALASAFAFFASSLATSFSADFSSDSLVF